MIRHINDCFKTGRLVPFEENHLLAHLLGDESIMDITAPANTVEDELEHLEKYDKQHNSSVD